MDEQGMAFSNNGIYNSSDAYMESMELSRTELAMWRMAAQLFVEDRERQRKQLGSERVTILDIGCGPGCFADYLHQVFPDFYVVGIDLNQTFIREASQRFERYGWQFIVGDALTFSLRRRFDYVFASCSYHHIDDDRKADFLANAKEHLSPTGAFILCEHFLPRYATEDERLIAVDRYYQTLKEHTPHNDKRDSTLAMFDDIHRQERAREIEHKIHFGIFEQQVKQTGFIMERDIPVFQPPTFRVDGAGSHVLLLRPEV